MIKIIKEGKKPIKTKRVYKTTCQKCGCEFEFEEEDCITFAHYKELITVQCPYCGGVISGDADASIFTYEDREISQDISKDLGTDENTFKIHPEDDPTYRYYDVHIDKYDLSKHITWNPDTKLPDDINNYISRVNSIDNYKLPDDYKLPEGYKLDRDCSNCPLGPCYGGPCPGDSDITYTNCAFTK